MHINVIFNYNWVHLGGLHVYKLIHASLTDVTDIGHRSQIPLSSLSKLYSESFRNRIKATLSQRIRASHIASRRIGNFNCFSPVCGVTCEMRFICWRWHYCVTIGLGYTLFIKSTFITTISLCYTHSIKATFITTNMQISCIIKNLKELLSLAHKSPVRLHVQCSCI